MKKISPIKQKILQYIDYKQLSKYEFYKVTGITRGILDQENGLTESNIEKFLAYFKEVNPSWLLTGRGKMLLTDDQHTKNGDEDKLSQSKLLPLLPTGIVHDFLSDNIQLTELNCEYFMVPVFIDADFLTAVRDTSMYPTFNPGDIVAGKRILTKTFIQWNKVYLLNTEQGLLVKRIAEGADESYYRLTSDNDSYKPFQIKRTEIKNLAIIRGSIHLE